jgi:hypothetical protein
VRRTASLAGFAPQKRHKKWSHGAPPQ